MATPPAGLEVVRPIADQGIADRIEYQRNKEREANQSRLEANDRAVKQKQEIIETVVLDAESCRAKTVRELEHDGWCLLWRPRRACA